MKIFQEKEGIVITDFNEIEALRLALKVEDDGIKFYLKASEISKDPGVKKIFKMLSREEEKHIRLFKNWLEELGADPNRGDEERFFDFISPGVFGDIFELDKIVGKIKNDIDALGIGEAAEVNSINFYKAVLRSTENEKGKEVLKQIIKEEQKHLKTFIRYKEKLERCK